MAGRSKKQRRTTFFRWFSGFFRHRPRNGRRRQPRRSWRRLYFLLPLFSCLVFFLSYYFLPPVYRDELAYRGRLLFTESASVSIYEHAIDLYDLFFSGSYIESGLVAEADSCLYAGLPESQRELVILRNRAYLLGYDQQRRNPAWVAYRLYYRGPDKKVPPRPSSFESDPRLQNPVQSRDYTGSGFDRGHMAPNYAIAKCYGDEAQKETFLMSNISPQRHELNAGLWKNLEMRAINNYTPRYRELWVITGPVYESQPARTIPSGVALPEAFFKIFLDEFDGRVRCSAFMMPQDADRRGKLTRKLCSIDDIEEKTGLRFFPQLSEDTRSLLKSRRARKAW
ncbi:MAG: DNA/RNA non-specific endonuclease [Lentisphaerae bacterium]|nr:DNA/RNA non-specific endonuclease [Lentisphaerota bacterium]